MKPVVDSLGRRLSCFFGRGRYTGFREKWWGSDSRCVVRGREERGRRGIARGKGRVGCGRTRVDGEGMHEDDRGGRSVQLMCIM